MNRPLDARAGGEETVIKYFDGRGRWGPDDEAVMLSLVTAQSKARGRRTGGSGPFSAPARTRPEQLHDPTPRLPLGRPRQLKCRPFREAGLPK
jgi:hypothetical protein